MKIFEKVKYNRNKKRYRKIKLFGKTILRYAKEGNIKREIDCLEKKLRDFDFDDAYLIGSASGETFLLMQFFNQILDQNQTKKPLFLFTKEYQQDIIRMFYPDAICVKWFSLLLWCTAESNEPFISEKHRFYFPFNRKYYTEIEKKHFNEEDCYFFENIIEKLNLKKDTPQKEIVNLQDIERVAEIKEMLGEKFIIISKTAVSNGTLSDWFWMELEKNIKDLGYEIFFNDARCGLSFPALRYLAKKASMVIGVRSGALDLVVDVAPKIISYYLPFKDRFVYKPVKSSSIMKNFSLKSLPNVNSKNVSEFDVCELGEYEVLKRTIEALNI